MLDNLFKRKIIWITIPRTYSLPVIFYFICIQLPHPWLLVKHCAFFYVVGFYFFSQPFLLLIFLSQQRLSKWTPKRLGYKGPELPSLPLPPTWAGFLPGSGKGSRVGTWDGLCLRAQGLIPKDVTARPVSLLSETVYCCSIWSDICFLQTLSYTSKYASGDINYPAGHYASLIQDFLLQSWGRTQKRTDGVSCASSPNQHLPPARVPRTPPARVCTLH